MNDSSFIFYYADHGNRSHVNKEDDQDSEGVKYRFSNYNNLSYNEAAQFSFDSIQQIILDYFNGKLLILLADCCY